jgi:hypothetical protein
VLAPGKYFGMSPLTSFQSSAAMNPEAPTGSGRTPAWTHRSNSSRIPLEAINSAARIALVAEHEDCDPGVLDHGFTVFPANTAAFLLCSSRVYSRMRTVSEMASVLM